MFKNNVYLRVASYKQNNIHTYIFKDEIVLKPHNKLISMVSSINQFKYNIPHQAIMIGTDNLTNTTVTWKIRIKSHNSGHYVQKR